jgi:septal ring factor EnvC (AmiA/AmiB activator)
MLAYVDVEQTAKVIGYISSALTLLAALSAFVWYVIKGKNTVALRESVTESQNLAQTRKEKIAEVEKERDTAIKERDQYREQSKINEDKLNNATQSILELHASRRRLRRYNSALERAYSEATGHRFDPPKDIALHDEDFDS